MPTTDRPSERIRVGATAALVAILAGCTGSSPGQPSASSPAGGSQRQGYIYTVAGSGAVGYTGDGGQALAASFRGVTAVAFDQGGAMYIADRLNGAVRRVGLDGVISTVAGGPAFALGAVTWVEFDPAGALFLADRVGSRIWKLNPTGSLSLVAGTGTVGFSGDGGPAIEAELDEPAGFTFDRAGSLFIAEAGNHRVRKVDRAGVITTVAGTGVEGSAGDGGPATQAQLDVPNRLLFDRAGNLLIDNYGSGRVRSVSPNGIITTIASGLKGPHGLALDASGRLYIAEYDGSRILRLEKDGRLVVIAGTGGHGFAGDAGPATKATLNGPRGVTIDSAGNVYIADDDNNRLRKIPSGANTA